MTGKERFKKLVDEGREGKNIGLSIGSPKLGLYMDDYLPGVSYLIGGNSGTGKSTFTLEKFIYNPLQDFLNDESKCFILIYMQNIRLNKTNTMAA
jgi:hypothetical protein